MNKVPAKHLGETMTMSIKKTKQQPQLLLLLLLAKEVFSLQRKKFRRERKIIPLYKDGTWSADLIDKSSLSNNKNNYKFILTVIDTFTKYAWDIPLKNTSDISITNGFQIVLGEIRKPEKLYVDRGSEFYKTFEPLQKEYRTELYSTYSNV